MHPSPYPILNQIGLGDRAIDAITIAKSKFGDVDNQQTIFWRVILGRVYLCVGGNLKTMLLQIKKTGDKTYSIDGNPYFISGLICFVITFLIGYIGTRELDKSFLYATGLTIVVTLIVYILDQVGKKKHKRVISSNLFQHLGNAGFEVEEQGGYNGLIGERKQIAFRVYYDWNKLSSGFFSFGDIVIIGYFEPLMINLEEGIVNEEVLDRLNRNCKGTLWKRKKIFSRFTTTFFIRHLNYYPFTKTEAVISELDKISTLIKENGLKPIYRATLLVRQKEFSYNYAPPIETFDLL